MVSGNEAAGLSFATSATTVNASCGSGNSATLLSGVEKNGPDTKGAENGGTNPAVKNSVEPAATPMIPGILGQLTEIEVHGLRRRSRDYWNCESVGDSAGSRGARHGQVERCGRLR